ncbi:MAG: hypothetical protein ABI977_23360 [Acidobacteriota bacterium]
MKYLLNTHHISILAAPNGCGLRSTDGANYPASVIGKVPGLQIEDWTI